MKEDFDVRIGYWLKLITRKITAVNDLKLSKYNITSAQLGVLIDLSCNDGLCQKEMQKELGITAASFTGLVTSLESKGLIRRVQDEEDARMNRIHITKEGMDMKEKAFQEFVNTKDILVKDFTLEEQILLVSWLKKMYKNIQDV